MSTARYFHGSPGIFKPGDILLPGNETGITYHGHCLSVYATTTAFDINSVDWDDDQDSAKNRLSYAVDTALEWASYAANAGGCTNPSCVAEMEEYPDFHYEMYLEDTWLPCIHIYEIEPIGRVEGDPSTDVNASGVRMPKARVLREVTAKNMHEVA